MHDIDNNGHLTKRIQDATKYIICYVAKTTIVFNCYFGRTQDLCQVVKSTYLHMGGQDKGLVGEIYLYQT